ncbi:MAG: type IV pilus twitching motility protein PilT [Candidatus Omnitrophica bacterium]|nr:type IV pilus twitching motility protein PilT [Candidatus Omnitrophota bacterium]
MHIKDLFQLAIGKRASDLHLTPGAPPMFRVNGDLVPSKFGAMSSDQTKELIYSLLTEEQQKEFEKTHELDFSLSITGVTRCRVNVHRQRGSVDAAFRFIFMEIRTPEELGLPPIAVDLVRRKNGLLLVTGPAGVGKTTTLASLVDQINRERRAVIICIEDPIEYLHTHAMGIVKQREVGVDTNSFSEALKRALRQDPNVIVVGEMRDLETISTALTAAETGHLVLATLHTPDAAQTVHRILDVFPAHQQQQVGLQFAESLVGVVSQVLLPRADGEGRVLATEIMVGTPAIRNLVREKEIEQIPSMIHTGARHGMHTMDQSIRGLHEVGLIDRAVAKAYMKNPNEL